MNQMNQNVNSPAFYQQGINPNALASAQQSQMPHTPSGFSQIPSTPSSIINNPNISQNFSLDFSSATTKYNQNDLNNLIASFQMDFAQEEIPESTNKCKELFSQLKSAVQNLLSQFSFILNPANESKPLTENQFQLIGKHVENFNKTCDLLIVNLRSAWEAQMLMIDLRQFYKHYAHIDHTDATRTDGKTINSVNIQMQRLNELRNVLNRFLTPEDVNRTI